MSAEVRIARLKKIYLWAIVHHHMRLARVVIHRLQSLNTGHRFTTYETHWKETA